MATVETEQITGELVTNQIETLRIEREVFEAKQAVALAALREVEKSLVETKRAEQEALAAERAELQKQRDEIADRERREHERLESKRLAEFTAEQERLALIVESEEKARIEAMKPDIEKIQDFGRSLRTVRYPHVVMNVPLEFLQEIEQCILRLSIRCEDFAS